MNEPIIWTIELSSAEFRIHETEVDGKKYQKLVIEFEPGNESICFHGLTRQLQSLMMKAARAKHPIRGIPPTNLANGVAPPNPRKEKMHAMPMNPPPPPGPIQYTMPMRPPMSPSAIRARKLTPSHSFGRLQAELRMAAQRKMEEQAYQAYLASRT